MPTALPALHLRKLLDGVPCCAWVAISLDGERVVAYGSDLRAVVEDARTKGERDPLITRVPEAHTVVLA
jgi:Family of unknown function (DUF5678)